VVDQWVQEKYFPGRTDLLLRKKALYAFAAQHGKVRVLLGIAADEAKKRIKQPEPDAKGKEAVWMQCNIVKSYPLVDMDYDRRMCQTYIVSVGAARPAAF